MDIKSKDRNANRVDRVPIKADRLTRKGYISPYIATITLFSCVPGFAQNAAPPMTGGSDGVIEEVIVTGIRSSIEKSLESKRSSVNVVDYITAQDIGKFPDNNLSESLQRVPGVTIDRSETGEGKQINVRGLGPQFSRTEVNGGSGINGFDFTLLPSEMFTQVSVEKSPTASAQEGALAGVVRAETPKPFSHEGTRAALSVTGVYGEESGVNPRIFGLVSKNWDDQYGLSLSVFHSTPQFEASEIGYGSWVPFRNTATAADRETLPQELLDAGTPRTPAFFKFTEDRENTTGAATFQARPTDQLEFTADIIYSEVTGDRIDDRPDIWTASTAPTNTTIENGVVTSADFSGVQARIGTTQSIIDQEFFQGNLRATWEPNEQWKVSPGLSVVRLDESGAFNLYSFAINGADASYTVGGDVPVFSSSATDFSSNPEDYGFNIFLFDTRNIKTEEDAFTLDTTRFFEEDSPLSALNFGIRYADRDRIAENSQRTLLFSSAPSVLALENSTLGGISVLRDFDVSGAPASMSPGQILGVDLDAVKARFHPNTDGFDEGTDFVPSGRDALNYLVNEKTFAAYASLDFEWGNLLMNAGLRYVRTDVTAEGSQVVGSVVTPREVKNEYEDYLPSFNLRYELIDNGYIRGSYSRTVNRPTLDDLRPAQAINSGSFTGSRGNPALQPFRSDMVDLGFEYYFHEGALFQVTGFIKEIGTLITLESVNEVATFPDQVTGELTSGVISFTQPVNGDEASIKGVEIGLTTPFYFLEGFASGFGAIFNYTYADSEAKTQTPDGVSSETVLPGLSEHSLNAAIYYDRGGWNSRLAYTWRDEYLRDDNVGRQFGATRFFEDYGQLDYNLTVPFSEWGSVSFEVLNITDEQSNEFSLLPSGATPPTNITERERMILMTLRATF